MSETWFQENESELYKIEGYQMESLCRKENKGGGVALCIKNGLSYSIRHDLCMNKNEIECIFVEISGSELNKSQNIIVASIYRPPNTNVQVFNEIMMSLISKLKLEKKCFISRVIIIWISTKPKLMGAQMTS